MPRTKMNPKGGLTGSKHFEKPQVDYVAPESVLSDEAKAKLETARASTEGTSVAERLKAKFDAARGTVQTVANGVGTVANGVGTVANGVKVVANGAKAVRRAFAGGSPLVTEGASEVLDKAKEIASGYGVDLIDIKGHMSSDPYEVDDSLGEGYTAKEANEKKLKIQRQNNKLDVRLERIKQKRKIVSIATEEYRLVGDLVDFATTGIEVATKVVNNQIADTNYQVKQSKLEESEELLVQQQIRTQGTINLTEGVRTEWDLKFKKKEADNKRLELEVEGALRQNERKLEEIEALLLAD